MSGTRTFALVASFQLALLSCVSSVPGLPANPNLLAAFPAAAGPPAVVAGRIDSVRCVSSAGALDALVGPEASSSKARFSPRWREGTGQVVTVRISDATELPGWSPSFRDDVVTALNAWEDAGSPVRFALVGANEDADVVVHWINKFDARFEGWTTVSWNRAGWILNGDVTLALHSPSGQLLTAGERAQVATHEIGHVLGLSHNPSPGSIMSPMVHVTAIAPIDVSTLRALYDTTNIYTRGPGAQSAAALGRCSSR